LESLVLVGLAHVIVNAPLTSPLGFQL
jgi:hypothetical protein